MSEATERRGIGVVLMNMGGPASLEEVRTYMRKILADRRVVRLPGGALYQGLFAEVISRRRQRRVQGRYAAIGGRSPLLGETRALADRLEAELGLPVSIAMRYSAPSATDAVAEVTGRGAQVVVGLPLYPQYSDATTGSSVDDLARALPDGVELRLVDRHHRSPGFLEALARSAADGLERAGDLDGAHLLLTAHSVPRAYARSGDPYVDEVRQTVDDLVARLDPRPRSSSLAFQSAMRFGQWQGPSLTEELDRLLAKGLRRLVVQPVTFVSENLETLYDLDVVFRKIALERGVELFIRQPTPGPSAAYVEGMARQVRAALGEEEAVAHA